MITLKESLKEQIDRANYEIELDMYKLKIFTNFNYFKQNLIDRISRFTYTSREHIWNDVKFIWDQQTRYTFGEERTENDKDLFAYQFKLYGDLLKKEFIYFPLSKIDEYNEKFIVDYSHYFNVEQGIPNIALKNTKEFEKLKIANDHFLNEKKFIEEIPWKPNIRKHLLDLTIL